MSAFSKNIDFEQAFTERLCTGLAPVLDGAGLFLARHARADANVGSAIDRDIQRRAGDFSVIEKSSGLLSFHVDLKVERRSSPNLFFETHSNYVLEPGRYALGWGITLEVDRIWCGFADTGAIAGIDLAELRRFLGELVPSGPRMAPRLESFRGVRQARHVQPNVTYGRLVPWAAVPRAAWKCCMFLNADNKCELGGRTRFISETSAACDPATTLLRDTCRVAA